MNAPNQSLNQSLSTHALVKQIKEADQDFEWYPTTEAILSVIKDDIKLLHDEYTLEENPSILDCGAGDGRSLMYLTKGRKFAIEKSQPLITAMDKSIYVIGADFYHQTFMDKDSDIIYSNPPYTEFEAWAVKILRETCSGVVYLVLPRRWKTSTAIQDALELRNADAEILDTQDFLNAERQARATVDVIRVMLKSRKHYSRKSGSSTDPFDIWFEEHFKIRTTCSDPLTTSSHSESIKEKVQNELVKGNDYVTTLAALYDRALAKLIENYKAFESIDPELLGELGVEFGGIREGLRQKISGLKNLYWNELFNNLTKVTDKLTKTSRENMLNKLTSRTDVDFNTDNVYAVVIWVIKNANHYYDDQLIELVERMVEKANVQLYKSNKKTFGDEDWRFSKTPNELDCFSLDYRIVLQRVGGLSNSEWQSDLTRFNGLKERTYYFLLDILTIATNLGFDTINRTTPLDYMWKSGKRYDFYCYNHMKGQETILMTVKAFKNGNLHIFFNQQFLVRLNIEFGRLKGWLKSAQQAAGEMDIDVNEAVESFKSNLQLTSNNVLSLEFTQVA